MKRRHQKIQRRRKNRQLQRKKQKKIRRTADVYLAKHAQNTVFAGVDCRFDVIGIDDGEITHIEDAF